ncbi:structural protein [Salinibacter phage M31CR41-2]|uniref:Structural protein n=2 Tax=Kairosalinivirus TaxID=2560158 RepID=A0A2I6UH32_9CAUD|nr:structural protein [Salinibacter phage M31CR41-2]YP_009639632.1 structural protein [Salinibacter phage SRUTV-1]ATU47028.1 structural protein [Salinibacter phage SRUTV-1]AUO79298.1 structural protein [Salinibacter phage M31CR41-2]
MPELQYTEVSDFERKLGADRFSKLAFEGRPDPPIDYTDAPADPFTKKGWRRAAYALLEAEEIAEDCISRRYEVPVDRMPEHVKGAILDIAVYKLHRTNAPDGIEQHKDEAHEMLQAIADGAKSLNLTEDEGVSEDNDIGSGQIRDSVFSDL